MDVAWSRSSKSSIVSFTLSPTPITTWFNAPPLTLDSQSIPPTFLPSRIRSLGYLRFIGVSNRDKALCTASPLIIGSQFERFASRLE